MSFYYISDLHLELYKEPVDINQFINISDITSKDYLILAGDIGNPYQKNYQELLQSFSKVFHKVYLVSGNHEFYNNDIDNTHLQIHKICNNYNNIVYLNNSKENLVFGKNNIKIIGTTLWTKLTKKDLIVTRIMNDYKMIKNFDYELNNKLHNEAVKFLEKELEEDIPTIVITHHLPSICLIDKKYKTHSCNKGFYSDLHYLIKPPICAWVCGHTHLPKKMEINKVSLYLNPKGYPNENTKFSTNEKFIINIQ